MTATAAPSRSAPAPAGPSLAHIAKVCRALSDENRLRIVAMLKRGERCVCELTDSLDLGQSLLSHHLKALKDAGLVTDRRDGRWVYYTLDREALSGVGELIESLTPDEGPLCCG